MAKEKTKEWDEFDAKLSPSDIVEMQTIDADCNDCIHFQRGKMVKYPGLTTFKGTCGKTGLATTAYPTQYSGHACFEHRRAHLLSTTP